MAISISSFVFHPPTKISNEIRLENSFASRLPSTSQTASLFGCSQTKIRRKQQLSARKSSVRICASQGTDSMSSIITELESETDLETENGAVKTGIADKWRELHGKNNWEGMFSPIDPLLRVELIRYGELAQACYDAFDYDKYSKYCGSCRFPRKSLLESLALDKKHGYNVSRYLYATSDASKLPFATKSKVEGAWSSSANWIGFVAVSDDDTTRAIGRRDIAVTWRGTVTGVEWVANMSVLLMTIPPEVMSCPDPAIKVNNGFFNLYTDKDSKCNFCRHSAREQILTEIKRLIEKYPNEEISITVSGHSLGAALAILSAYDIAQTRVNVAKDGRVAPVCVFSFAGPRVGNLKFKEAVEELGVKVLRVVNVHDTVPKTPGLIFNENSPFLKFAANLPFSYTHVGVEFELDHKESPYLKETDDAANAHNMEGYLHLIDGYRGKGNKFKLTTKRDPALVNKASDLLKDEYVVPPAWRQDMNKGMILGKDGRWYLPERPKLDDHPNDMMIHLKELGFAVPE